MTRLPGLAMKQTGRLDGGLQGFQTRILKMARFAQIPVPFRPPLQLLPPAPRLRLVIGFTGEGKCGKGKGSLPTIWQRW